MKKTKKKVPIDYYLALYGQRYLFFVNWPRVDFLNYVVKNFKTNLDIRADWIGATVILEKMTVTQTLIWTNRYAEDSTLAHECVHAATQTLIHIGDKSDYSNDEVLAYLVGHLFYVGKNGV